MNNKRIIAWIIDFVITSIIQFILMALFLIRPLMSGDGNNIDIFNIMGRQLIITFCSILYLIIRDIIGNKSIGKRIMKLKIVDRNNNDAYFLKRLFRNITWFLGPVEIIIFLISGERLGDKIMGTKIIENKNM
jgi:uncharacterized RDD family membrane protein YckC